MPTLAERQAEFAAALLDPEREPPGGVRGGSGSVGAERFAVYRNNVAVGLIEALRSAFPVVNRLVGDEFFAAMARAHALRNPPSSPVLLAYGGDFPDFIAQFEPVAALAYLADVARLEWLWLEAYHAADAVPLGGGGLDGPPVARLPDLRLTLSPATRFFRSPHPALTIWRMHQRGGDPEPIELAGAPEQILLVRPGAHVEAIGVSSGVLAFLEAVQTGDVIAQAVEAALAVEPGLALGDMLSRLFVAGAFSGFVLELSFPIDHQGDDA